MIEDKNEKQEPLTLDGLIKYNQDVLFPYLEETFAGKKEFNEFKNEMTGFKNESLTNQDAILKKLDILLDEKEVKEFQEKKQKKILAIHNESLKRHQILSPEESAQIAKLEFL